MGLDPGIDHMLAMECIDQGRADGCTVSVCKSVYVSAELFSPLCVCV